MGLTIFLIAFLLALIVASVFMVNAVMGILRTRVPYVPTADWAVRWLTEHLELPPHSRIYDLGCGDGRVLVALARQHPECTFVGVELQWWPALLARWRSRTLKNVAIHQQDFWSVNIHDATHVFCYIFIPILERMRSKFEQELTPRSTVISYGFSIPGWATTQEVADPSGRAKSRLLFYRR